MYIRKGRLYKYCDGRFSLWCLIFGHNPCNSQRSDGSHGFPVFCWDCRLILQSNELQLKEFNRYARPKVKREKKITYERKLDI